ncbi:uncharacterized protein LOC126682246 [Mercurialis annua]|uniref:uncharacterized protein LOC126682246 n=1 Tax=Mercurialis annua TaxID=3986 RepID=UPI00215E7771|nr:uncharacterized protein LOC126682246 [Mercurialis annua]
MALYLTRPKHRSLTNPSLIHLFSTSSPNDNATESPPQQEPQPPPQQPEQPSFSTYFSDLKLSLKQQQPQNRPPIAKPTYNNPSISQPTSQISIAEIKKNLAEFRRRSAAPSPNDSVSLPNANSPPLSSNQQQISFHELYKRNMAAKSESESSSPVSRVSSFDAIRESLRQIPHNPNAGGGRGGGVDALSALKDTLKMRKQSESMRPGSNLPFSGFGKEQGGTSTWTAYKHKELGEKLRSLRPEVKEGEKGWFSLEELSGRLKKLKEIEEKDAQSRFGSLSFNNLRDTIISINKSQNSKKKSQNAQRFLLSPLSSTPSYMLYPPKDELVEKYFHPDNMSSAEKLKIELSKVREEFKMSESDCGSARVQVAQLTTKIKHLSSVLHKKDKHSRKGLQEMVQNRKKLLKYLRRTDWDSYCLVLSRLGLRDNSDFKYLARS